MGVCWIRRRWSRGGCVSLTDGGARVDEWERESGSKREIPRESERGKKRVS
jgi:hypothetical protein